MMMNDDMFDDDDDNDNDNDNDNGNDVHINNEE